MDKWSPRICLAGLELSRPQKLCLLDDNQQAFRRNIASIIRVRQAINQHESFSKQSPVCSLSRAGLAYTSTLKMEAIEKKSHKNFCWDDVHRG
jgi:hypothetical protein